ncbi:hypothetical protein C8J57DRAFT_1577114 [Mycena rebaudengoi]|nr:hypothetical protein C8J57DRAFT_1577114 [Mycena rebaudengoi]
MAAAAGLVSGLPTNLFSRDTTTTAPTCLAAINSILTSTDPNLNCLNRRGLSNVFSQSIKNLPPSELITPVNQWLDGFCGSGFCRHVHILLLLIEFLLKFYRRSNSTLEAVSRTLTDGCGPTISEITLGPAAAVASTVVTGFPIVRKMMCLKNEATNKYCMTDNLQLNNRTLITDNAIAAEQLLFGAFNQGCTSCGKAAFGLYNQHLEVDGKRLFDSVCGVGFVDNSTSPVQPGVKQTAVDKLFVAASNTNDPNAKNDKNDSKKEGGALGLAASTMATVIRAQ